MSYCTGGEIFGGTDESAIVLERTNRIMPMRVIKLRRNQTNIKEFTQQGCFEQYGSGAFCSMFSGLNSLLAGWPTGQKRYAGSVGKTSRPNQTLDLLSFQTSARAAYGFCQLID
jgi:hypothetical protein